MNPDELWHWTWVKQYINEWLFHGRYIWQYLQSSSILQQPYNHCNNKILQLIMENLEWYDLYDVFPANEDKCLVNAISMIRSHGHS